MTLVITGTHTNGVTLDAASDNPATVAASALVSTSSGFAIYGDNSEAWRLTNRGTLSAAGFGVTLAAGGSVFNASGAAPASIAGGAGGVAISGAGYLRNTGTIRGTGASAVGVSIATHGVVVNAPAGGEVGVIAAGYIGVALAGAGDSVSNIGTIASTGTSGFGVRLAAGGTVSNLAGASGAGRIVGASGVAIYGASGYVSNQGTIVGNGEYGSYGVAVHGSAVVSNGVRGATSGVIVGGVRIGSGSVTNFGLIDGFSEGHRGIYATSVNGYASVVNFGTVTGLVAVRSAGYLRLFNGMPTNTDALLQGRDFGAYSDAGGIVVNAGSITAGIGVLMFAQGTESLRVTNGSADNTAARIAGSAQGIYAVFYGTIPTQSHFVITNYGVVSGASSGIVVGAEGGNMTLINGGLITNGHGTAGVAVSFTSGTAVLAVTPSGRFVGDVIGSGGGRDILDLTSAASAGRIAGIGTQFLDFENLWLDPGARWSMAGPNSLVSGSGITLFSGSSLAVVGTLEVGGSMNLAGSGSLDVGGRGVLEVGGAGQGQAGALTVDAGDTLSGFGVVLSRVVDQGVVRANKGVLTVEGSLTGSGIAQISAHSVLVAERALSTSRVAFVGGGATLELAAHVIPTAAIAHFGAYAGNGIELLGTQITALSYATVSGSSGVLTGTLAGGGHVSLGFTGGSYGTGQFHLSSAAGGSASVITFG